jgi:ferritin-like protein
LGRKSREIVRAKVDDVVADLTKAYADEWFAHYQYWLAARYMTDQKTFVSINRIIDSTSIYL